MKGPIFLADGAPDITDIGYAFVVDTMSGGDQSRLAFTPHQLRAFIVRASKALDRHRETTAEILRFPGKKRKAAIARGEKL